tara:strand:- start:162 stop:557 length:396 start_codon:yes stop_codon:yes gene_type:complete
VTALAALLRKLPALKELLLGNCGIRDEGVWPSLVDNLGKDDFKALKRLYLDMNELTDKACDTLVAVLNEGGMPKLTRLRVHAENDFSDAAADALAQAAARRGVRVARRVASIAIGDKSESESEVEEEDEDE